MGKVKIRTIGDEEAETKEKQKEKEKRDQKALRQAQGKSAEEVQPVEVSEGEQKPEANPTSPKASRGKKESKYKAKTKKATRSKAYQNVFSKVDRNKQYSLDEALKVLPELSRGKFDETVELHINTVEQGVSGSITLPHGIGKQMKVVIADDAVLAKIEQGKIDFDVLLAHPQMMPKLAKVAKILGPRGLMPNPKAGTVTDKPEEAAKKYAGGLMNFKTEKSPIIHLTIGKVSFGDKKLLENINTVLSAIPQNKIRNMTLKSTMSPGIKVII